MDLRERRIAHYSPDTTANTLVPRALRALASANAHLKLNEAEGVVAHAHNDLSVMSIMGGWRSGHEPAWSGFVREGLWSAVACGDIFASSSTKQVLEAMGLAPLDAGTILLITNYTGDRLHSGLAAERARVAVMLSSCQPRTTCQSEGARVVESEGEGCLDTSLP
ncbi:Dihydroxyacetone kinase [Colletotrichum orbiculare MAFF 240422]|uniref:Dihydroxyacetone kinase n=1 Tax=Colletotrichum orbiculare (strain 104-T / ATCC 96160 / CBS 514.97 / LARS 414 / MAFF 240422) TaxID=1213857 RepID=A0A484FCF8_COLOR|nr:Dihydroxyacetone kinase [Colletotrichum orbiculare MAFF 240422]